MREIQNPDGQGKGEARALVTSDEKTGTAIDGTSSRPRARSCILASFRRGGGTSS